MDKHQSTEHFIFPIQNTKDTKCGIAKIKPLKYWSTSECLLRKRSSIKVVLLRGAQTKTELLKAFKHMASMMSKKLHTETAFLLKRLKQKPRAAQLFFKILFFLPVTLSPAAACTHPSVGGVGVLLGEKEKS